VERDVEVQDLSSSVLDDEEAIEQSERHCGHSEEVEGNDRSAMIVEEARGCAGASNRRHPGGGSTGQKSRFRQVWRLDKELVSARASNAHCAS
jgi:hypothetical protein